MKYMKKQGFTLVEITVAAVVFAASTAVVFTSVSSFRRPLELSTRKQRAAQLSKKVLDGLRQLVSDPTSAALTLGQHGTSAAATLDAEFPGYGYWYEVFDDTGDAVRVELTVRTPPP
jgi:prepilin-type N-terminal cleavage/methylation domain-containing protein